MYLFVEADEIADIGRRPVQARRIPGDRISRCGLSLPPSARVASVEAPELKCVIAGDAVHLQVPIRVNGTGLRHTQRAGATVAVEVGLVDKNTDRVAAGMQRAVGQQLPAFQAVELGSELG